MARVRSQFNVWAALLNLEKAHGDEASFVAVFQRALHGADPKEVHLHVASTHERAGDVELTDAAYEAACKKFKQARGPPPHAAPPPPLHPRACGVRSRPPPNDDHKHVEQS